MTSRERLPAALRPLCSARWPSMRRERTSATDARGRGRDDRERAALLGCRDDQADDRGDRHDPGREAREHALRGARALVAERDDGQRAEARRQHRRRRERRQQQGVVHAGAFACPPPRVAGGRARGASRSS